jgi:hypothetical protein
MADHEVHDAHDTTEDDKILAEAKKQDDAARKENEKAEYDAKVRAARSVFAPGETGPDGTAARRLAHPGEVTDAGGNPDPFGDHVNRGTALEPEIVPVAGLAPADAHRLGLPTGQGGAVADSGPVAPEEVHDAPVAKTPAKK